MKKLMYCDTLVAMAVCKALKSCTIYLGEELRGLLGAAIQSAAQAQRHQSKTRSHETELCEPLNLNISEASLPSVS